MQLPPLSIILSWPAPNYTNPQTRGDALLIVMIIFSILVFLAVTGRLYTRIFVKKWFGWDDAMIVLAFIFAISLNAVVLLANREYGWDRHVWDVRPDKIQNANIVAFVSKMLFVEASTMTRMSLLCFYHRLVKDTEIKWFRWILHAGMSFVVGVGVTGTVVNTFLCVPVDAYWRYPPRGKYHCLNEGTVTFIFGTINCVADLLCTTLPIPLVMQLKMPLKTRVGVCILLGLGFIVTIAGSIRTYFIWKALIDSWDTTWYSYPLYICSAIEIDLSVICACAPALKPWLQKHMHRVSDRISSAVSSLRSSHTTDNAADNQIPSNATKSSKRLMLRQVFGLKRSGGESIWDGDEEYRKLKEKEKEAARKAGVHVSSAKSDMSRQDSALDSCSTGRRPMTPSRLGVLKNPGVDQEILQLSSVEEGERLPWPPKAVKY